MTTGQIVWWVAHAIASDMLEFGKTIKQEDQDGTRRNSIG